MEKNGQKILGRLEFQHLRNLFAEFYLRWHSWSRSGYVLLIMKRLIILISLICCWNVGISQHIRIQDKYGEKLFYVEGNTVRFADKYGEKLWYFDGMYVHSVDKYGEKLFYIEGNTVRLADKYGEKLLYFDGNTIRHRDKYGEKLYSLDQNTLRYKDKYGDKILYFETYPPYWIVATMIILFAGI